MTYLLNPQRLVMGTGIFFMIVWFIIRDYFEVAFLYGILAVIIWITLLLFTRFTFKINDDHLVYQIIFLKKLIVNREIYPNQVDQLKFFRVGWANKAAIIKTNKGLNVRLAILRPHKAYDHLLDFCDKHEITVHKTKDYFILERMKKFS